VRKLSSLEAKGAMLFLYRWMIFSSGTQDRKSCPFSALRQMQILFTESANADYLWWKECDPKKVERIRNLLEDIAARPFTGIGKPEPLKFDLQGFWSRRIDKANRLVYSVEQGKITVISCRFHY
jgi:toxin YoeB